MHLSVSTCDDTEFRCNDEFLKAAARGISLLVSSGDEGVTGESGCGTECADAYECFVPRWPPGSPWVTVVGGTAPSGESVGGPTGEGEEAWFMSSGGFSNRFAMPDWQKDAVGKYLKNKDQTAPQSKFNVSGRAYPDVAAYAVDFEVVGGGDDVDGTSCSCPTFAGIIGLLNDLRLNSGKPQLGFLNPWLYQNAAGLTDVISGANQGCGSGFAALNGWDGVTGLGSPDYSKLKDLV